MKYHITTIPSLRSEYCAWIIQFILLWIHSDASVKVKKMTYEEGQTKTYFLEYDTTYYAQDIDPANDRESNNR